VRADETEGFHINFLGTKCFISVAWERLYRMRRQLLLQNKIILKDGWWVYFFLYYYC